MNNSPSDLPELANNGSRMNNLLGALQYRDFRYYWFSALSFVLGWQILRMVLNWVGYELTNSAIYLGALGGAMALGTISVSLIGGVIADRINRKILLITTQILMTIAVGVLLFLSFLDTMNSWHLLVASLLIGIIQGIDMPTRSALIPALIPNKKYLMNGLALGSAVWQGTRIFGPSLGGFMIKFIGSTSSFAAVTVTYFIGTILLSRLKIPHISRETGNVIQELKNGLLFISNNALFFNLILLTFVDSFFGIAYMQILPIFAKDILSVGPDGMGLLMGASAAGGLIGTFTAAVVVQGRWPRLMLIGGAALFGTFVLVFAISTNIWLSLITLFFSGIFNSLTMITNQTILQTAVPDELRGRVMGVFSLTYSLIPLGGLQVGILADFLGAEIAVVIGSLVVILFSLSLLLRRQFNDAVKNYATA
jgi:MFS family permease